MTQFNLRYSHGDILSRGPFNEVYSQSSTHLLVMYHCHLHDAYWSNSLKCHTWLSRLSENRTTLIRKNSRDLQKGFDVPKMQFGWELSPSNSEKQCFRQYEEAYLHCICISPLFCMIIIFIFLLFAMCIYLLCFTLIFC